jgi:shikimate dehydrogenase
MITGRTTLIAHIGYPTTTFKAPMIYHPWFDAMGIDAVVVPMGVQAGDYAAFLRPLFSLKNIGGALVTMPHKVATIGLVDEVRTTAAIAGSANAVRREADGRLVADMFDGEGFVRGMRSKGVDPRGRRALVVGAGGVGSAIAASLAASGVAALGLFDMQAATADALAGRLRKHYPQIEIALGSRDPAGYDIVVNATPLGMQDGDPLPLDVERIPSDAYVGEVVMKTEITPFLAAARARGCPVQVGTDMLFEQIPAYLEFFGFPKASADDLRRTAAISY